MRVCCLKEKGTFIYYRVENSVFTSALYFSNSKKRVLLQTKIFTENEIVFSICNAAKKARVIFILSATLKTNFIRVAAAAGIPVVTPLL